MAPHRESNSCLSSLSRQGIVAQGSVLAQAKPTITKYICTSSYHTKYCFYCRKKYADCNASFIIYCPMAFDPQELKHLMELAHITIAPDQEEQFFQKLDSIITELNKLQKLDLSGMTPRPPNVMQTIHEGVQDFSNTKGLLQNVEHPVVNNSIQIKSVLD